MNAQFTGSKSSYHELQDMTASIGNTINVHEEQQQKTRRALNSILRELGGPTNNTEPNTLLQALAKSVNVETLKRALDESAAGREILSSSAATPRPEQSNHTTEEPKPN